MSPGEALPYHAFQSRRAAFDGFGSEGRGVYIVGTLMGEQLEEPFQHNRSRQYDDTIRFLLKLAALYAEHEASAIEVKSQYRVAMGIVTPMEGMLTATDELEREALTPQDATGIAKFLHRVSGHVDVASYPRE